MKEWRWRNTNDEKPENEISVLGKWYTKGPGPDDYYVVRYFHDDSSWFDTLFDEENYPPDEWTYIVP